MDHFEVVTKSFDVFITIISANFDIRMRRDKTNNNWYGAGNINMWSL